MINNGITSNQKLRLRIKMVSKKTQETKIYMLTCIILILLVLVPTIFIITLIELIGNPIIGNPIIILIEYRNQSCKEISIVWTEYNKPIKTSCSSPSDCFYNNSLDGCHKAVDGCNQCCFNICNLMYCKDLNWSYNSPKN